MMQNNLSIKLITRPLARNFIFLQSFPEFDLAPYAKQVSIRRGKGERFSQFSAASFEVVFNNEDRRFDPSYDHDFLDLFDDVFNPFGPGGGLVRMYWNPSKYIGKRYRIRFDAPFDVGLESSFFGGISVDWSFDYSLDGYSQATLTGFDDLGLLAQFSIVESRDASGELSFPESLPGPRIQIIRDKLNFTYGELIDFGGFGGNPIDTGTSLLAAQTLTEPPNALGYINEIAQTEGGAFFGSRTNLMNFFSRAQSVELDEVLTLGDDGIQFNAVEIDYGQELLYNIVNVQNNGGASVRVIEEDSINDYGPKELTLTGLLGANDAEATRLAVFYASKYSIPKYRVTGVSFNVMKLADDLSTFSELVFSDLGRFCVLKWTPSGIGDPTAIAAMIVRVEHTITPDSWDITLGIEDSLATIIRLDGGEFGRLDSGHVLG